MPTLDYSKVVTYTYVVNNVQGQPQTGLTGNWSLFQGVDSGIAVPSSYGVIEEIGLGLYKSSINWASIKENVSGLDDAEDIVGLIDWGKAASATFTVKTATATDLLNETIQILAASDTSSGTSSKTYKFSDTIAETSQKATSDCTVKITTLGLLEDGTITIVDSDNTSKTYIFKEAYSSTAQGSSAQLNVLANTSSNVASLNNSIFTLENTAGTTKTYKFSTDAAANAAIAKGKIEIINNVLSIGETITLQSTDGTSKTYEITSTAYTAGQAKGSNFAIPKVSTSPKTFADSFKAAINAVHANKLTAEVYSNAIAGVTVGSLPPINATIKLTDSENTSKTYKILNDASSAMVIADPSNYYTSTHQGFLGFAGAKAEFQITDLGTIGDTITLIDSAATSKVYEIGGQAQATFTVSGAIADGESITLKDSTADVLAQATITFTGNPVINETITIISTDGTSKTYPAKTSENSSAGTFDANNGPTVSGNTLKAAIEHSNNHGGKITVHHDGNGVLTLTQVAAGKAGNTIITSGLTNTTVTNFTGATGGTRQYIADSDPLLPPGTDKAHLSFKIDSAFVNDAYIELLNKDGDVERYQAKTNGTNGNLVAGSATLMADSGGGLTGLTLVLTNNDGTTHTITGAALGSGVASTATQFNVSDIGNASNFATELKESLDAAAAADNIAMTVSAVTNNSGGDPRVITLTQEVGGAVSNTAISGSLISGNKLIVNNTTAGGAQGTLFFTGGFREFNKGGSALVAGQNLKTTIENANQGFSVYMDNATLPSLAIVQGSSGPAGNTAVVTGGNFVNAINGGSVQSSMTGGGRHTFRTGSGASEQAGNLVSAINSSISNHGITAENNNGVVTLTQDTFGTAGNTTITTSTNFENSTSVNPPAAFTGGTANGSALANSNIAIHRGTTVSMMGDNLETGIIAGHNGTIRVETDASNNVLMFQNQPGAAGNTTITKAGSWLWAATLPSAFTDGDKTHVPRAATVSTQATYLKDAINNATAGHNGKIVATSAGNALKLRQATYGAAGATTITVGDYADSPFPATFTFSDEEIQTVEIKQVTAGADGNTSITHSGGFDNGLSTNVDESFSEGKYASGKVISNNVLVGISGITTKAAVASEIEKAIDGSTGHNGTITSTTSEGLCSLVQAVGGTAGNTAISTTASNSLLTVSSFANGKDPTGTVVSGTSNIAIGTNALTTKEQIANQVKAAILSANGHNGAVEVTVDTSGSNPVLKLSQATAGSAGNKTNSTTLASSRITIDNFTNGRDQNGTLIGSDVGVALYDSSNAVYNTKEELANSLKAALEAANGHNGLLIVTSAASGSDHELTIKNKYHGSHGNTNVTTNVDSSHITLPGSFAGGATLNDNERYTHLHISHNDIANYNNRVKIDNINTKVDTVHSSIGSDTAKLNAIQSSIDSLTTTTSSIKTIVELLEQVELGKWEISNKKLILYKADKVTKIAEFDLFDKAGNRTETAPFSRVPSS